MIPTRPLGAGGPSISALGLGCMSMTEGPCTEAQLREASHTIAQALDSGVTFLNTGDFYGMGQNELLIGRALANRRERVFVSVKFGALRDPKGRFFGFDARPALIKAYVAYSLKRLGTDYIDLYQPSRVDPAVPIEETVGAVKDLIQAGYVRYLGLSEMGPQSIRRAHAVHPVTAVEYEYSILSRDAEQLLLPTLIELGVGLVAYGVFTHGLLSGRVRSAADLTPADMRYHLPQFQGENLTRNLALVQQLEALATELGLTLPQLAAAWVLARHPHIVPVIGARSRESLGGWLGACGITLRPQDLRRIDEVAPPGAVAGSRYPAEQMRMIAP
jgi:aryl-alcohol dehydrogenase-like predicted oxidoreductase